MLNSKLQKAALEASAATKARGENEEAQVLAARGAIMRYAPDLDQVMAERMAVLALREQEPGRDQPQVTRDLVVLTALASLIFLIPSLALAVIALFGTVIGVNEAIAPAIAYLGITLPVSLVIWPLIAWVVYKQGSLKAARTLCSFPLIHFFMIILALALASR